MSLRLTVLLKDNYKILLTKSSGSHRKPDLEISDVLTEHMEWEYLHGMTTSLNKIPKIPSSFQQEGTLSHLPMSDTDTYSDGTTAVTWFLSALRKFRIVFLVFEYNITIYFPITTHVMNIIIVCGFD